MNWIKTSALALLVASTSLLGAEPRWIRMHSPNFEVLSSASEKETRNTLRYFEQVRDFFLKMNGHPPRESTPVFILIFGSEKEYAPYSLNKLALAYFVPRGERDYIVMGRTGELAEHVATHEYTHLVAQHAGLEYPPWLNEGIAELFSTFTILNDTSVTIGDPIPERINALRNVRWVPLATIMGADENSPYYNEEGKAGSLYNEGWAAVHFLNTDKAYRPKFTAFLTAILNGATGPEALQAVYGKSLPAFETELQGYVNQDAFNHLIAKVEIDRTKKQIESMPASSFDVKLALADIDDRPESRANQRRLLEQLKMEEPKRPEPLAGLGYLDWQEGNADRAIENFSRAYALGDRSYRLLWDFSRLAESSRPQESVRALKDLEALEPDRGEVQTELAWAQYYARQFDDSLATLANIKPTTKLASRYFTILAYAQIAKGDRTSASRSAGFASRFAQNADDRNQAERLQRYLESAANSASRRGASNAAESSSVDVAVAPPRLVRPDAPGPDPGVRTAGSSLQPANPPLKTVRGIFTEFICPENGKTGLRFVVDTGNGKVTLGFATPQSVTIRGRDSSKVDLFCGVQDEKLHVTAEYDDTTDPGLNGILRVFTYEK